MKKTVSYSLSAAVRTWQPPPFFQHLHQSDDSHLTVTPTNHAEEELRGQGQEQVTKETMYNAIQYWLYVYLDVKHENTTPVEVG